MGKVHDALKKADKEHKKKVPVLQGINDKNESEGSSSVLPFMQLKKTVSESKIDPNLISYYAPQSVEGEMFKLLRSNILFPSKGKPPRSIMVTSAIPGDGKSFVSANLAISIAQGVEDHVLLMDCDMRSSSIHNIFGYDDVPGLSEYLSKGEPISSLILKTIVDKLTLLPGGTQPPNPSELLSSQQMADLLVEVKTRYKDRFVILDSPPPQLTAETHALARSVDAIVLVVRSGKTPRSITKELVEKLGRDKILGVVLNDFRIRIPGYYGYGKKTKYHKK